MSSVPRSSITTLKADFPAGLVVFLVAVPLCLGIAQASSAPLLSGLVAGIVGGIVVALASGSPLSVSGPAAGLAVVVAAGIRELGLRPFLLSVVIAGALQLVMGALRLGAIAHYFPSAVIKGMLAAIGVLIVLKQVPHALGYDKHPEGQLSLRQVDGSNTFSALGDAAGSFSLGALAIALLCAAILWGWPKLQRSAVTRLIPPALVAVVAGALAAALAVVLIFVGLKLTTPALWRQMWGAGPTQFVPFAVTIAAIVSTDLLKGTVIGLIVGLAVMIRNQQRNAIVVERVEGKHVVRFMKDMTFLQKGRIKEILRETPADRPLVIDRRVVDYVDDDVEELLDEHCAALEAAGASVEILFEAGAAERYAARRARRASESESS